MKNPMPAMKDILYVRFTVTDLAKQLQFLQNFGLHTEIKDGLLIARGSDSKPYIYLAQKAVRAEFVRVGLEADSIEDLYAIAAIDEAEVVNNPLPGGGLITQLIDPKGFCIAIVAGQQPPALLTVGTRSGFNNGQEKHRIGAGLAFEPGDCPIKRLGHAALFVHGFATTFAWYAERSSVIISDQVVMENDGTEQSLGAFTRSNRGDEYVDHHTKFFMHAGKAARLPSAAGYGPAGTNRSTPTTIKPLKPLRPRCARPVQSKACFTPALLECGCWS